LDHFKKLHGKIEFHQNKCHLEGVPDMWRQCAKVANQWAQGVGWLCSDTLQEVVEGKPKMKVGGGRAPWLAGYVARMAGHHLTCY
jgi:hypothetical protein